MHVNTLPFPSSGAAVGRPVGPVVEAIVVVVVEVVVFTARKEKIRILDWHADYIGGLLGESSQISQCELIMKIKIEYPICSRVYRFVNKNMIKYIFHTTPKSFISFFTPRFQ